MELREKAKLIAIKYNMSEEASVKYFWSQDRYVFTEGDKMLQVDPQCIVFIDRGE